MGADAQAKFIATNCQSLAQAKAEWVDCGVGSILRLMIDRKYQRRGYGRAALLEELEGIVLKPGEVYLRLPDGR